jgi:hypothetical protein
VFSKLVKAKDIRKVSARTSEEDSDIPSDFAMLRDEINNGIITSDVLNALRRVATNAEWNALRGLELVTATAYLARDRRDTAEEWAAEVMGDRGTVSDPLKPGQAKDTRTRAWWAVPLEGFIGRLVDARRQQKARSKDPSLPEQDRA